MDILYLSILTRLKNEVPELNWIDEECGQLELPEESYPVQFPCCLIDIQSIVWTTELKKHQEGICTVRFRIGFDIYEDTNKDAPDIQTGLDRLKLLNKIHSVLHGFGGYSLIDPNNNALYLDKHFKRLVRTNTVSEQRQDALRVYAMDYMTSIQDVYAEPPMILTPVTPTPVITGTFANQI